MEGAWAHDDLLARLKRRAHSIAPRASTGLGRWLRAAVPYPWLMSSAYRRTLAFLQTSQWWSKEQLAAYQLGRVRAVVSNAAANVPGYRCRFAERGLDSRSIEALDDLRAFPFLTKEDLRDTPEMYVTEAVPRRHLQRVTSGGTTGTPTAFYHLPGYNDDVASAFRLMMWKRAGYEPRVPALDLTGSFDGRPTHYYYDRNLLCVSISALDYLRFPSYASAIRQFRPQFVIGFPSTVTLYAQLARHFHLTHPGLRGVILSSEVMNESQRRYMQAAFGCRILQWYGLSEYAGFASGCEQSSEYHFFPESCYLELVDADGQPVTEEGEEGEIVLTGLYNIATPFIRYRTGDRGVLGAACCRWCGRNYPLLKQIAGRIQEFLVARNGRPVPASALNLHDGLFDQVWSYQFYQDAPGRAVLNILRKPSYGPSTTETIRRFVLAKLGEGFELDIAFPRDIQRTPRGKHAFIVQKLRPPVAAAETGTEPAQLWSGPEAER